MNKKIEKVVSFVTDIKVVGVLLLSFITGGFSAGTWFQKQEMDLAVKEAANNCKIEMVKYEEKMLEIKTQMKKMEIDMYQIKKQSERFKLYANYLEANKQFTATKNHVHMVEMHKAMAKIGEK